MAKDYYAILGISPQASAEDIKAAYRRLVKEFHPDHHTGGAGAFRDIQEAYATLGGVGKRRAYDARVAPARAASFVRGRRPPPEPLIPVGRPAVDLGEMSPIRSFATHDPSLDQLLDWLSLNDVVARRPKSEPIAGLTVEITLSRQEAQAGSRVRILVPARARCPVCRGHGGIGTVACHGCRAAGIIEAEVPVVVAFPTGLTQDHAVILPLERLGIRNVCMTVLFRPSDSL
jgi:DnaJ-class molecular chaperone